MSKSNNLSDKEFDDILGDLNPEEYKYLMEALNDSSGDMIDALWQSDYEEIPVDIMTFMTDDDYLGHTLKNDDGKLTIYNFWQNELKNNIFNQDSKIWELALSGSIGSGKSTVAVVCMAYILYKLLCLKDPVSYYKLAPKSKVAIVFYNLNLNQVYGVGYYKLQSHLSNSPWFLRHGTLVGRGDNKTYYPGKDIEVICASRLEHTIGRDVFCLYGDTLVETENGPIEIRELQNNPMKVYNSENVLSDFPVYSIETMKTSDLIEIELENGDTVKCTPNHKFMLKDGTFKEAQYLKEDGELKDTISICGSVKIKSINKIKLKEPVPVYDVLNSIPTHDFQICVGDVNIVSHNCCMMDEIDYAQGSSMEDGSKILKFYNQIRRRMESRYMKLGSIPGMLIMVSSKNSEDNFLEQYINENRSKPYLHIIDEPLWVVKADLGNYCGKTFNLAVGNRYRPSHILTESEDPVVYESNGQRVIQVPIEHREAFEQSMNQALMDIAGIAISSYSKYLSYDKVKLMYRDYLKNPFSMEIITLGFDDDSQIIDFLDESKLSKLNRNKPHYIHWDASVTGDCTGLAMTSILSSKKVRRIMKTGEVGDVSDIVHKIDFGIKIRAASGEEIPFYKIRNFILYLHDVLKFNIASVTADSYQSVDNLQLLKLKGYNTATLSVDRIRDPYETAKNAINEGRVVSPYIKELERELIELEDDRKRNKIDHPQKSNAAGDGKGSKDLADCVAACIYKANQMSNAEFESAEKSDLLKAVIEVNEDKDDLDDELNINNWL